MDIVILCFSWMYFSYVGVCVCVCVCVGVYDCCHFNATRLSEENEGLFKQVGILSLHSGCLNIVW